MINKVKKADKPENVLKAADFLKKGGVIIHPTETIYGFAANALMPGAIRRVDRIKSRQPRETYLLLVRDKAMALGFKVRFSAAADNLAGKFWPGPLTLVLPVDKDSDLRLLARKGAVGVRVSSDKTVQELFRHIDFPLISTSVNRSGDFPLTAPGRIAAAFGLEVDMILERGELPGKKPSTVVAVMEDEAEILRPGVIPEDEINGA